MKYNFIEIGCCDFDTLIQKAKDEVGLSIELMQYYLDKLPNKPNVKKICCAVGDIEEETYVYYILEEDIISHKLKMWLKGCTSIYKVNPTLYRYLEKEGKLELLRKEKIKVFPVSKILKDNEVEYVEFLKLDLEGMDCRVLNQFLIYIEENNIPLPKKIEFESNVTGDRNEQKSILKRLQSLGYITSENRVSGKALGVLNEKDN